MWSIVISTVAYFVASHYIKRYFDDNDIPKGMTRGVMVFCLAAGMAYGVAYLVDWVVP